MAITNNFINTSATVVYSSSGNNAITTVYFCNTGGSIRVLSVYLVPSGDTPDDMNKIYHDIRIPAGDTFVLDTERLILENGDSIQAHCDTSGIVSSTVVHIGI